jgi:glutaryl-CoA dehydrogenase
MQNVDYLQALQLTDEQEALRRRLRGFLEDEVRPILPEHWDRGEFPRQLIPRFAWLCEAVTPWPDPLTAGLVKLELGRVDPSSSSFFSVHRGLSMGAIERWGSPEQQARWLPAMARMEALGSFALTEPLAGSDVASHMGATAREVGDLWQLTGSKKWAGSATIADVIVAFARTDDGLGAFLVEAGAPGLTVERIPGKIAKRALDNALVTLEGCPAQRLPGVRRFRDVTAHLTAGRISVAWEACGVAIGAYEIALRYAGERQQFGRPLAANQLVQAQLVEMLSNVTTMLCVLAQIARVEAPTAGQASLAKRLCARRCKETVAIARDLLGGNGVLLEYGVAHLFADAEAISTYEGTDAINTLIVGRDITGVAAF